MSKENKVNPGQYTQAGRLTQDETAREMKKQRETSSPSHVEGNPHPFQASKRDESDEVEPDDTRAKAPDATKPREVDAEETED